MRKLFPLLLFFILLACPAAAQRLAAHHFVNSATDVQLIQGSAPFGSASYIEQPAQVGNPSDPGYDDPPIAYWDWYNYDTTESSNWNFAVVTGKAPTPTQFLAGIENAIDHVQCRMDDGPWAVQTSGRGTNPRTGVYDTGSHQVYLFSINAQTSTEDTHEIACIVYPLTGWPLVMQGRQAAFRENTTSGVIVNNPTYPSVDATVKVGGGGVTGVVRTGDNLVGDHMGRNYVVSSHTPLDGSAPGAAGAIYGLNQLFLDTASGGLITNSNGNELDANPRYNLPFALIVNTRHAPGSTPATAGGFAWVLPSALGASDSNDCTTASILISPATYCKTIYGASRAFISGGGRQGHTTDIGGGTVVLAEQTSYINGVAGSTDAPSTRQYLTIMAGPSVDPEFVILNANSNNGMQTAKVRYSNLKITSALFNGITSTANNYAFTTVDGIHFVGDGCQTPGSGCPALTWSIYSVPYIYNSRYEYSGTLTTTAIQNTTFDWVLNEQWTGLRSAINSTIQHHPFIPNVHQDWYQARVGVNIPGMVLMSNVQAWNSMDMQMYFSDGNPPFINAAVLDSKFGNAGTGTSYRSFQVAGRTQNLFFNNTIITGSNTLLRDGVNGSKFVNAVFQNTTMNCPSDPAPMLYGATKASPSVFRLPFNDLGPGAIFTISGIPSGGMTQLNNQTLVLHALVGDQQYPATSTFSVYTTGGVPLDATAYTAFSQSFPGNVTLRITAISNAAQAQVTQPGHPYVTGDRVTFTGLTGMTQLNGNTYRAEVIDADHYYLKNASTGAYIDSSAFGVYTTLTGSVSWAVVNSGVRWQGTGTQCN